MAKEIIAHIKLQIPAGQANPAPPVGTALGPRGVNIMAFCQEFNAATQKQAGDILPVVITVFKVSRSPSLQESARRDSSEESGQHRGRFERAEQGQGWQSDAQNK